LKKPTRQSTRLSAKKKSNEVLFIDLESDDERPIKTLKKTLTNSEEIAEKIKKDFKVAVQKRKSLKE